VKKWVDKLDAPTAGTNIKTFVYQVENNTAQNIADVLGQLYQDGFGLPSAPTEEIQEGQPQQPITPPREAGFVSPVQQGFQQQIGQQLGPSLVGRPMSTQSGIRAVVAANIKIIVNEFNNSLIIQATEADYQFLLQTIKQLDVLPRQVWIEAKIYSVELRDDLSFGVAAFLEKRGANGDDMGGPATTAQISPEGTLSVATRAFIGRARQLEAVINTLRSRTDVEIVEAPRLLAIDGMQASINVGAEVPVTTASFGDPLRAGTATAFVNAIQFRPTGTTLLIMPRISASGIVTMDLAIEVSSASGAALTPTINRNFITTSLIVRDGQTVAIAGIISDQADFARNRVPLLGDIPILGALFGQTTRTRRRAELIFFITPYVIRNLPTATELTLEFRRALRKAYDFIREKEAEESELIQERREKELRK
ncbi:MAG: type II secretion system protein GspD, partial [Acidobacteriota bacterium]